MDSRLSRWGDIKVGCAPGQYLVSGRPLSLSPTKESQQQMENGVLGKGKAKVLEGGAERRGGGGLGSSRWDSDSYGPRV